jgi:NAD(P)-dependent dehydrogenase (short-subunit alcohol dehydrogenase family)
VKRVVITGVSGGVGSACAKRFLEAGWEVYGQDRVKPSNAGELTGFLQGDVSDPELWAHAVPQWLDGNLPLHALVNNAATQITHSLLDTSNEEWDEVMAVNLKAPFMAIKSIVPLMAEEGAAIINVSSVHALATSPNISAYASTKGGLLALTRAAALDLAERNIRVNAVLPGATNTDMLSKGLERAAEPDELGTAKAQLAAKTPLGRIGTPQEIAESIYFLADKDRSSFITGETLVVDGGAVARLSTE